MLLDFFFLIRFLLKVDLGSHFFEEPIRQTCINILTFFITFEKCIHVYSETDHLTPALSTPP